MTNNHKRIVRVDVTSNCQQVAGDNAVALLCYIGQPGERGTGPHRLKVVAYKDARKTVLRHIGVIANKINVQEYVLGDYAILDSYTLKEFNEKHCDSVGIWGDPDTGKGWLICHEQN